MALHGSKKKSSELGHKFNTDRSRDESPSSTQIIMEHDAPTTTQQGPLRTRNKSNGDESRISSRKSGSRREDTDSSSEYLTSSEDSEHETNEKRYMQKSTSRASRKRHKQIREYPPKKWKSSRDRSPRDKKTPEKIPYFTDAKREADRIRAKYEEKNRSRNRSFSRPRRRSRTRSHSRDRRRPSHRRGDRERSCSPSYDRHHSWRNSRSPSRRHDPHDPHMLIHGGPPFIPVVPLPFPPQFAPAHFPPRFPPGMLRPPYPHVVYYVPQPLFRPRGGYMPRPGRPWRNNN